MCRTFCGNDVVHEEAPLKKGVSRREFLAAGVATLGATVACATPGPKRNTPGSEEPPRDTGTEGRRYILKGGAVLSMDPSVGDFPRADVLVEGKKIVSVGPNLEATGAAVIDATGTVVMPGFIDTHHHQFETALRSFLAEGLLLNDGRPHGERNYFDYILQKLTPVYRPEDVYISELLGSLSQLDAGVTTVVDTSQVNHTPEHSDAAIRALREAGRRAVYAYASGQGAGTAYPRDLLRLQTQYFSSTDQLLTLAMNAELSESGFRDNWALARQAGVPIVTHLVGSLGHAALLEQLGREGLLESDTEYIHATGLTEGSWKQIADTGGGVSIAAPIELTMRHGMPPLQTALDHGIQPSLSVDVECTMTADFFTQMRTVYTLQRGLINQRALNGETQLPELLTCRDVIRFATVEGARVARVSQKVGSLTPGKEADLLLLRTDAINVAPLNNVPGAIVTLMERSNVDTVIVAGRIRKWRGALLDVELGRLRSEIEASRDYLFEKAGVRRELF
ncbi:amidohydrolase family protein [Archangium violaceum]|uniref:amidohydrolase family protein n=1 Tax=Archangium violaceum TaxID=83451 RepID=UPI002B2B2B3B|nr:amidohydrolase family protein [Archangium violaceum]